MALVVKSIWAKRGSLSLAGRTVPFWGFAASPAGPPLLPGPTIDAVVGDTVFVVVRNADLPVRVSVMFPGQDAVWALGRPWGAKRAGPVSEGGRIVSFTDFIEPGSDAPITYTFRATRPGAYLYESGTDPEIQVQMGLYGALIVRPRGYDSPFDPDFRTAYGAGTGTGYDLEKTMVIAEIDSAMHEAVGAGLPHNMLDFSPDFWLVSGRCYPDTLKGDGDPLLPSQPAGSSVSARAGQRLLIRLLNAGFLNHTFHFGGLIGRIVAGDARPLTTPLGDNSYQKAAVTLGSGQGYDVILALDQPGRFYLRAAEHDHLVNSDDFPGGMMARLDVIA